ncbi:MAG: PKD domain-containing protein [Bacteroidota bacterium]
MNNFLFSSLYWRHFSTFLLVFLIGGMMSQAQIAYVPNSDDGTLSVIDVVHKNVVRTIPIGPDPRGVSSSPDGTRVYVSDEGGDAVQIISTATNSVIDSVVVGNGPAGIWVSPDNNRVYVADYCDSTVSVIDATGDSLLTKIPVGVEPGGVMVSPDGSEVWVTIYSTDEVMVIDATTNTVTDTISVGLGPQVVMISPDGSQAFVSNTDTSFISVIDAATKTVTSTLSVMGEPRGLFFSPDGDRLYATTIEDTIGYVYYFDITNNFAELTVQVDGEPTGICVTPDGAEIYVANYSDDNVMILDAASLAITDVIPVGAGPISVGNFISSYTHPYNETLFEFTAVGQEVHFTDLSHGTEVSRLWQFGDGGSSTDANPTHFYAIPDSHLVTLTVIYENGDTLPYSRLLVIDEFPMAHHQTVAVPQNSPAYAIDVMTEFGYTTADHQIQLLSATTYGPFEGSASVSGAAISYQPNAGYVGTDIIEYSICSIANPALCDTGSIFIDVFEGNCAYIMQGYSTTKRCPNTCGEPGGDLLPPAQPTPDGCWGYVFFFENTSNEPMTELNADFFIDGAMTFDEGSGQIDGGHSTTAAMVTVTFDSALRKVNFQLAAGEQIMPHEIYEYSFRVDINDLPTNGPGTEYHTHMEGYARCAAGKGEVAEIELYELEGGACDPNEISVLPEGCGPMKAIGREVTTLTYTIEFENEGSGAAKDVSIRDVLPDGLDMSTLHVIDGAPFRPQVSRNPAIDSSEVNFIFHNIHLPPASQDSLGSRGHVKFTIDIKANLPAGTLIENWADIFFDQQFPVRTDTTLTTVEDAPGPISGLRGDTVLLNGDFPCYPITPNATGGSGDYSYLWTGDFTVANLTLCPFATGFFELWITDNVTGCVTYDRHNYTFVDSLPTSIDKDLIRPMEVIVAPNPFASQTTISISGDENAELEVAVYNSLGQKVADLFDGRILAGQRMDLPFNGIGLPAGMYFYRLSNRQGLRQTGKLILTR